MVDIVKIKTGKFKGEKAYVISREFNSLLIVTLIDKPLTRPIEIYGEDVEFIKGSRYRG